MSPRDARRERLEEGISRMFVNAHRLSAEADLLLEARVSAELADVADRLHALNELLVAGRPLLAPERPRAQRSTQASWLRDVEEAS